MTKNSKCFNCSHLKSEHGGYKGCWHEDWGIQGEDPECCWCLKFESRK